MSYTSVVHLTSVFFYCAKPCLHDSVFACNSPQLCNMMIRKIKRKNTYIYKILWWIQVKWVYLYSIQQITRKLFLDLAFHVYILCTGWDSWKWSHNQESNACWVYFNSAPGSVSGLFLHMQHRSRAGSVLGVFLFKIWIAQTHRNGESHISSLVSHEPLSQWTSDVLPWVLHV